MDALESGDYRNVMSFRTSFLDFYSFSRRQSSIFSTLMDVSIGWSIHFEFSYILMEYTWRRAGRPGQFRVILIVHTFDLFVRRYLVR